MEANISYGTYSPEKDDSLDNDFIPFVSIDYNDIFNEVRKNISENSELSNLSSFLDSTFRSLPLEKVSYSILEGNTKSIYNSANRLESFVTTITIKFNVAKGNPSANDDTGKLKAIATNIKIIGKSSWSKIKYGSNIQLTITSDGFSRNGFIDFYADDDDWYFKTIANVHCGRIKIVETLFQKILRCYPKPYSIKPCTDGHYNQCAIRMSMALNNAGIKLAEVKNVSNLGGKSYCTHGHVLGAYNLKEHIKKMNFWQNESTFDGTKQKNIKGLLKNKTGILYFENFIEDNSRTQAAKHIEVWNGIALISMFDEQMFDSSIIIFFEIQ